MDGFITHTCWMRYVPDDTSVMTLSIPGTHNSCCVHGLLGLGKAQELDLPDQLNAGIRFVDIRFTHYQDNLCVHHDVICTEKSYVDVLTICFDFLRQHPSETILMSVDDESRFDDALGEFAPSRIICKLPMANTARPGKNTRSFEDTFNAKTWECIEDIPLFYNFIAVPPGSIPRSPVLPSHPKQRSETFAARSPCYADSKAAKTLDSIFLTGRKTIASEVQHLQFMISRIAIRTLEMMTSSTTSLST
jgi:hypothetical protein